MGFDGAVAAGHRVPVDWYALPHTERLVAALSRAKTGASIVVDDMALTVESGPLCVRVPVLDVLPELPEPHGGVERVISIDGVIDSIRHVLPCCRENAPTVLESAIELADGAATATNRVLILQSWHALSTPRMIVPRAAAAILVKQSGLTTIAGDASAATFWFGPDKWLRFNLYQSEDYPNVAKIFDVKDNPRKLPENFKEAVAAVAPHVSSDGLLYIDGQNVFVDATSFKYNEHGQEHDALRFKADYLKMVAEIATEADFDTGGKMIFYGDKIRGALAHVS